jgi:hypothetical protein
MERRRIGYLQYVTRYLSYPVTAFQVDDAQRPKLNRAASTKWHSIVAETNALKSRDLADAQRRRLERDVRRLLPYKFGTVIENRNRNCPDRGT